MRQQSYKTLPQGYGKAPHTARRNELKGTKRFQSTFQRDLFAMQQVWEMLKKGAIRWFGEVGRQY